MTERIHVYKLFVPEALEDELFAFLDRHGQAIRYRYEFTETDEGR